MATAVQVPNQRTDCGKDFAMRTQYLPAKTVHPIKSQQISVKINGLQINGFISADTGVANLLNIPYARIPARFCEAKLIDPRQEVGVIDATKYGACCPQPFDIIHDLTGHLYPKVIDVSNAAEFTCLSVNIYAPPTAITSAQRLPVFVWIHGGAFTYGDASDEYDGNYMVQHSMALGKPIIVASMNYRVGPYGFLTSKEIKAEALSRGEKGYANLGFHDQRLALQWIQRNIQHFGGNGSEVTASGESAGGCSLLTHLRGDFPAFQRAFIMSAASIRPAPFSVAQARFDTLISKLGISASAPAGDKLAALRSVTPDELNRIHGPGVSPPTWDPDFYPAQDSLSYLEDSKAFPSWLKGIVIGSAKEEAALFVGAGVSGTEAVSMVKAAYEDIDFVQELLQTYNFKEEDSLGSGTDALIRLITHGTFTSVAHAIASEHSEVSVSLYSFDQIDPFERSPWKGRAFHSLGNSMLFRQPTVAGPYADEGTKATSNKFCEAAILLTIGEQPWEPYAVGHKMMVFDGDRSSVVQTDGKALWTDLTRTHQRWDWFKSRGTVLIEQAIKSANNSSD